MAVFKKSREENTEEPAAAEQVPQTEEQQPKAEEQAPQANGSNGGADPLDKLGVIRDIIFGQNMEEYNQQFNELKRLVDEKKAELDNYIQDVKGDLQEKIQELDKMMKDQVHDLEDNFAAKAARLEDEKMNRATLGDLLIDIGTKIKS
ncbi:MAG TPA: hypothetical protein DCE41_03150 [Cytophagales bacterium]|nr:hypothetical protein [Cytophagales bacterium]HAA23438.1 hypothetical protein [Cytophagales bacterium]HAP58633.1 hypothetical protein [Cytophagales bacterium]